jgi:MbtH protein
MDDDIDGSAYLVVRNDEEQYSIWPAGRELPLGWHAEGTEGTRKECLDHINEVWVDMRPLSLRQQMEQASQHQLEPAG